MIEHCKETEPLMIQAWVDCLLWAIQHGPILKQFMAETGNTISTPTSPIDLMIDQATGVDKQLAEAFIAWFNDKVWGAS